MLKFPLHSAIVTIEQKSSAYGYGYYSCSISSSFARTSVVLSSIAQVFYYLSCLAVSSLLNVQNNSKSNTNRPSSKSQTFENQLKINEHISLIIFNSLCHRFIHLGDLRYFFR